MSNSKCIYNPFGEELELDYLADSIFHVSSNRSSALPFLIRIFGGGNNNIQTLQLKAAIQELNIDPALYTIETLTCDDVNVNHYTIKYIVTWLLGGSVHFITGHIHQGLQLAILDSTNPNGSCFTMKIIIGELQRLKYHRGFPFGSFLRCPVFLQDKFEYLSVLQKCGMCNPTLKVNRSDWLNGSGSALRSTILDFLDNCKEEGCDWVVKLPFVTNQIVKGIKTKEDVFKKLAMIFTHDGRGIYHYAMIQPCMRNRKEYKVVYIPSKNIIYVSSLSSSCGNGKKAFSFGDHSSLFAFVKTAVHSFQVECPYAICDGLFRVDVFMNQSNQLVVNEFESLEATYYSSREKDQTSVTSFLKDYWLSKLASLDIVQQITSSVEVLGRDGRESATQDDNTKKKSKRARQA